MRLITATTASGINVLLCSYCGQITSIDEALQRSEKAHKAQALTKALDAIGNPAILDAGGHAEAEGYKDGWAAATAFIRHLIEVERERYE